MAERVSWLSDFVLKADLEKALCTTNLGISLDASFDAVFATWKTSKCIFNAAQAQPKRTHALAHCCSHVLLRKLTKSDTLLHSLLYTALIYFQAS